MAEKNNTRRNNHQQSLDPSKAHLQPQATDMERAVLGAILIDNRAYGIVCELLIPESFYEPRHQKIYGAIRDLSLAEKPVDILSVTEQLAQNGQLEEIGGPGYITELSSKVASSANVEYHSRIVAQKFLFRELFSYASELATKTLDSTSDIDDVMQYAEGRVFELAQRSIKRDYEPFIVALKASRDKMMRAYANKGELTGIPTLFTRLDEITDGWQKSDLIIIAGRPAMGKTSFALSLLKNIAVDQQIPSAFFSLEMSSVQLADRLISNVTNFECNKIIKGQLSDPEISLYEKRISTLCTSPIFIDDTPGLSILELRTKARRLVREHGVGVIFVDYLQLMNANGIPFHSRQEEISIISRNLKGLAKELDIPVIALSQLNRGVESREGLEGKRPQLSDLRESGAIEQDADVVLLVHRPEYYRIYTDDNGNDLHGMAQIIVAKNRKGATDDILLTFRGEFTRFENPEDNQFPLPDRQG
ncbi:MAG: replicative DNA helicase [Prevotella sp.]|nr:replicative DNA helicase [Prevotella sp.]